MKILVEENIQNITDRELPPLGHNIFGITKASRANQYCKDNCFNPFSFVFLNK